MGRNHRLPLTGRFTGLAVVLVMSAAAALAGGAPAGAAARPAAARPAGFSFLPPKLAPCTKPLFGPDRNCESTSPKVSRWWKSTPAASHCTEKFTISWGDGSKDWTGTFTDKPAGVHLLASHTYNPKKDATYTEVVRNTTVAGNCGTIPDTSFVFSHLTSEPGWWTSLGISRACADNLLPDPVDVGLGLKDFGHFLGLFPKLAGKWAVLFEVIKTVHDGKSAFDVLFKIPRDCPVNKAESLGSLPAAYAFGAHHPGKLFKPSMRVPAPPRITAVLGYTKGALAYFSLHFADPGHDAKGFGFVGIKGSGFAEENHPFSSPSFGIVGHNKIDYPFNIGCGTAQQQQAYVEAWLYDKAGVRSQPVVVALRCTN